MLETPGLLTTKFFENLCAPEATRRAPPGEQRPLHIRGPRLQPRTRSRSFTRLSPQPQPRECRGGRPGGERQAGSVAGEGADPGEGRRGPGTGVGLEGGAGLRGPGVGRWNPGSDTVPGPGRGILGWRCRVRDPGQERRKPGSGRGIRTWKGPPELEEPGCGAQAWGGGARGRTR